MNIILGDIVKKEKEFPYSQQINTNLKAIISNFNEKINKNFL